MVRNSFSPRCGGLTAAVVDENGPIQLSDAARILLRLFAGESPFP